MEIALSIINEIADLEQIDPLELPSFHDSIDADALERCIESAGESATIQFTYCLYEITVEGDGTVIINPDGKSAITHFENSFR